MKDIVEEAEALADEILAKEAAPKDRPTVDDWARVIRCLALIGLAVFMVVMDARMCIEWSEQSFAKTASGAGGGGGGGVVINSPGGVSVGGVGERGVAWGVSPVVNTPPLGFEPGRIVDGGVTVSWEIPITDTVIVTSGDASYPVGGYLGQSTCSCPQQKGGQP